MAQHFFVRGPSVNPNFGSPATFIEGLQKLLQRPGERRIAEEKVAADELFREQTLAQGDRRQDFLEAAPERARAEKLFTRTQENIRAQEQLAALENSGFSQIDSFLENEQVETYFKNIGVTDINEKRRQVEEFARKSPENKRLFSKPGVQGQKVFENIIKGGGNLTEANAAKAAAIAKFPTLPSNFAEKLIDTSSTTSSLVNKIFGGTGVSGGKAVQPVPNQLQEEELRDTLTGRISIEDARGGGFVNMLVNLMSIGDPTRSVWDFGQRDLDQGDIDRLIGTYGDKYPQYAIIGALRSVINPDDGTLDQDKWQSILNDPDSKNSKAFVTEIQNWQSKSERTRGGKILNNLNAKEIFQLAGQLEKAQDARNLDIINRTIPQGGSFKEQFSAFTGGKIFPNTVKQNDQKNNVIPEIKNKVIPEVVDTPDGTGSAGLDQLLAATPQPAEFQIGGPVPEEAIRDKIFDIALTSPAKIVAENVSENVGKLFKSLTPPGPSVLSQKPTSNKKTRQAQIDRLTGKERSSAMNKALMLRKRREISITDADGEGRNADESLLIAYFKYLEGQRR